MTRHPNGEVIHRRGRKRWKTQKSLLSHSRWEFKKQALSDALATRQENLEEVVEEVHDLGTQALSLTRQELLNGTAKGCAQT